MNLSVALCGAVADSQALNVKAVAAPQASVERLYVGDHPIVTGATGSMDGNYAYPPNYIRTNITAWTAGTVTLSLNQGV